MQAGHEPIRHYHPPFSMQTDSETESETENSNDWNSYARSPIYTSTPPKEPRVRQTDVLLAIEKIKKVDLSVLDQVSSLPYDDNNTSRLGIFTGRQAP